MNFAPSDSTCSFTAGRMSDTSTSAPSRRAVATACSPATPAPRITTLAGLSVPAAVISIGKSFPSRSAAMITDLYPAMFACDESASIGCAREMRGISSMAKTVSRRSAMRRTRSMRWWG
jgi:hypothetical protein